MIRNCQHRKLNTSRALPSNLRTPLPIPTIPAKPALSVVELEFPVVEPVVLIRYALRVSSIRLGHGVLLGPGWASLDAFSAALVVEGHVGAETVLVRLGVGVCEVVEPEKELSPLIGWVDDASVAVSHGLFLVEDHDRPEGADEPLDDTVDYLVSEDDPGDAELAQPCLNNCANVELEVAWVKNT